MIHGIGTDLVEVSRIERILTKWGDRFLQRVYANGEIEYCNNKAFPAIHFAARFAAKESFLKSLGIGLGMGVKLREIEVSNNELGSPVLKVNKKIGNILDNLGVNAVHVSMTHTREHAHAIVVLER
ncbi:MAG: holo-ACP synthase [Syntrophales bacterium]|jgi:holo-[acyl-carrier protein] synthase